MLVVELNGAMIGLTTSSILCLCFLVYGKTKRHRWSDILERMFVTMLFGTPVFSVVAMYAIEPLYVYGGHAPDVQHWRERWVVPPENTVNIQFLKTRPGGEFCGKTDRASWDAWRIKNGMVNEENWGRPHHFDRGQFSELDVESGVWIGYVSEIAPNGAAQRTWFRESDGIVFYIENHW